VSDGDHGPRPDHRTVFRPDPSMPPAALAATEGICPLCDGLVNVGEELVLSGAALVGDPDRRVDLTDAEWQHLVCPDD